MQQARILTIARRREAWSAATFAVVWLSGCDPVVSIAGADFPDWLVCTIAGCLLGTVCHLVFRRAGLERYLRPLPFFYGSLILMFALIVWVTFFNRV